VAERVERGAAGEELGGRGALRLRERLEGAGRPGEHEERAGLRARGPRRGGRFLRRGGVVEEARAAGEGAGDRRAGAGAAGGGDGGCGLAIGRRAVRREPGEGAPASVDEEVARGPLRLARGALERRESAGVAGV